MLAGLSHVRGPVPLGRRNLEPILPPAHHVGSGMMVGTDFVSKYKPTYGIRSVKLYLLFLLKKTLSGPSNAIYICSICLHI